MAENLETLTLRVGSVLQDTPGLLGAGSEVVDGIRDALEQYSLDAPRTVVADVAGDGSTYDLALPSAFVDGFARVVTIEYPAGAREPTYLDSADWRLYRTASATTLRLVQATPAVGETVRLTFTAPHTIEQLDTATVTTIPSYHTQAFVYLATAKCLQRLADRFLHEQEATLNLDSVERGGKADQARRLIGTLLAAYRDSVGVTGGAPAAMQVLDWDSPVHQGLFGLTHRRRRV